MKSKRLYNVKTVTRANMQAIVREFNRYTFEREMKPDRKTRLMNEEGIIKHKKRVMNIKYKTNKQLKEDMMKMNGKLYRQLTQSHKSVPRFKYKKITTGQIKKIKLSPPKVSNKRVKNLADLKKQVKMFGPKRVKRYSRLRGEPFQFIDTQHGLKKGMDKASTNIANIMNEREYYKLVVTKMRNQLEEIKMEGKHATGYTNAVKKLLATYTNPYELHTAYDKMYIPTLELIDSDLGYAMEEL